MLGPLMVEDDGREITLGGPRQRTVLALLLANANKVVSTDFLIDELYGEVPPEAARKSLQSYVANLRKAVNVGSEMLRGRPPGYVLEVESRHVDALHFESQVMQARAVLADDPAESARRLTDALGLWYGIPLVDVADESAVLRNLAGRLEELRLTAVELRIDANLALGRHQTMVPELENLTVQYPFRERFWEQLMLALYRSARQGDALRTFQKARRLLADELGIDPSPELQRLEQRILEQDPELGGVVETTVPSPALPEPGRTVRGYELRQTLFDDGETRLFRAYHPAVGREVTIEVIGAPRSDQAGFVRTFGPRAAAVARLEHPHLVPLLDYWREPGSACLVTRWYEGGTLADALRTGPWTTRSVLRMVGQIAPALAVAHRSGVTHGRLDPAAVLLDRAGNAYLGRFGLATDGTRGDVPHESAAAADLAGLARLVSEALGGSRVDPAGHPLLPGSVGPAIVAALTSALDDPAGRNVEQFLAEFRAAAGSGPDAAAPSAPRPAANPYKGLKAFTEADAPDFFGRRSLTRSLLARMAERDERFLAIVGPSGSGKSSVVRAGLVPALRRGELPGSEQWFIAEMSPGASPFEELETALLRVAVNPPATLLEQLEGDSRGLLRAVRRVLPGPGVELVLVVDQFEDLFTRAGRADRDRFIESLLVACTEPNGQLHVVITMRADFYDRPLENPALAGIFSRCMETVYPMTPEELEQAISGPAARSGVAVEPELDVRIVADVADQPGALPLLQYAMTELFDRRTDSLLTSDSYQEIGGVLGALARRAEESFQSLDADGRATARQLFLRLVVPESGGGTIRRRVARSELTGIEDRRDVETVIEKFAASRLLTLDHDPVTRAPTVDIGHDALIEEWPRLRDWIGDAREDLRLGRRLAAAAAEWRESGNDDGYLLSGSRLAQYEMWSGAADVALTAGERSYLDASLARRATLEAVEQERRQRELVLERRSARRLRILVGVLAVSTLIAGALTVVARSQTRQAERNLAVSTARALTAEAVGNLEADPELSVLLALEAARTVEAAGEPVLRETVEALHRALLADRVLVAVPGGAGALSPDGTRLVTADPGTVMGGGPARGTLTVWDAATGEELITLEGHTGRTTDAAYDPTGGLIVSASMDRTARLWDATSGRELQTLAGHRGWLTSASFSPDGSQVLTTSVDGTVRLWSAAGGEPLATYSFDDIVTDAAMAPDGRLAVALDMSGAAVVAVDGTELLRLSGHGAGVCAVALDRDGTLLMTGGQDGLAVLWDAVTGEQMRAIQGHSGPVCGVDISRDGRRLVTAAEDGTARIWNAATGELELTLYGHRAGIGAARLSPDGRRLATASGDKTSRVWEVSGRGSREDAVFADDGASMTVARLSEDGSVLFTGAEDGSGILWGTADARLLHRLEGHTGRIFGAAFSGDGALLATAAEDTTARIWEVRTGRLLHVLTDHGDGVWGVDFSAAGDVLLTGSLDSTVRIWDVAAGTASATIDLSGRGVFSVGFGPAEDLIYAIGEGVSVFEAGTMAPRFTLDNNQGAALDHAFSPDGALLAVAGADGTIVLYQVDRDADVLLTEIRVLTGHTGGVLDVEFSPDGTLLASSSLDNSVRLWTPDGAELLSLPGVTSPGTISFNADGTRLVVPGADGSARMLIVPEDELFHSAIDRLSRGLTLEECERFSVEAGCGES